MSLRGKFEQGLVMCADHRWQPGYFACVHVVDLGAKVHHHRPPNPKAPAIEDRFGSICCVHPAADHTAEELVLLCSKCATAHLKN